MTRDKQVKSIQHKFDYEVRIKEEALQEIQHLKKEVSLMNQDESEQIQVLKERCE